MAELVDALDLGSSGATRESSSLSFRTIPAMISGIRQPSSPVAECAGDGHHGWPDFLCRGLQGGGATSLEE